MRVAVVTSGHIPSQWAHSVAVAKNANGFVQCGHDVELLSPERLYESQKRRKIDSIPDYYGISEEIDVTLFPDKTPYYFSDVPYVGFALDALSFGTFDITRRIGDPERKITAYIEEEEFDLAYCRTYRATNYLVEKGVPTIMESHSPTLRRHAQRRVMKNATKDAFCGLVTIGENLKDNFVEAGVPEEKVLVLQDGVDLDQFADRISKGKARSELGLPADQQLVVYVGSLHEDKGIRHSLQVASRLPNVRFQFVGGDEDDVDTWSKTAADIGADNTHFSGYVPNREVPKYLAAADVLLMPYKTDHDVRLMDLKSTSPLKLFEYMAAERPIVSSDIPAISRTLTHEETGLLAEPNDVDELVSYVTRVFRDEEFATKLAQNARNEVPKYSWQSRCETMIKDLMAN
ncbi:glycosyltransferase [Halorubrum sp. GN11_10-6_MGM]|uniref:glycosyltransferase family 4 protein n=1 Tax=Halorubrum sp. GN11_10-6_MGM TaxID=2518112 RepID=UPI0010F8F032|nr:glycosyltransferase family 4 protein [Halorubrum sp. GN11_10-6_MGM]TKX72881.1 glycosyltransferase [Halorubrum sp. GN11_10-6_MGM]